jgi:hypothetical protein
MTEKTFTFTVEQIKAIFDAGRSRGAEEECSFQCGSRTTGWQYDALVEAVYDIENAGTSIISEDHVSIFTVEEWFKRTD